MFNLIIIFLFAEARILQYNRNIRLAIILK
jgi:hypothetical protein